MKYPDNLHKVSTGDREGEGNSTDDSTFPPVKRSIHVCKISVAFWEFNYLRVFIMPSCNMRQSVVIPAKANLEANAGGA